MPDTNSNDNIVVEDEETSDTNEVNEQGDAQVDPNSESSDTTSGMQELQDQLDQQRNSAETLGYVSSASANFLLEKAKEGDANALELIESNSRVNNFIKNNKRLKKEYASLTEEKENPQFDPQTLKADIKAEMRRDSDMDNINALIQKSGIKGEQDVERVRRHAQALYDAGESPQEAFNTAHYGVVGEKYTSQPKMPTGGKISHESNKVVIKNEELNRIQTSHGINVPRGTAIEVAKKNIEFDKAESLEGSSFMFK